MMRDKAEHLAQVAVELGAARALVQQKEAELRQLLSEFATANQLELAPLHPLPSKARFSPYRERHGEMVPKLILAMKTEMIQHGQAIFDAKSIAHIMDCPEQAAKIRLQKAYARGHLTRVAPGQYTVGTQEKDQNEDEKGG